MIVRVNQIAYAPEHTQYLSPHAVWYDNSNATEQPCLENHVISQLINDGDHDGCDYFGVLSWAFERKRAVSLSKLLPLVDGTSDVFAFDNLHKQPNVWRKAETWHKGIIDVAREVFKQSHPHVAERFDTVQTPNIYSNAFLTRPDVYEQYVYDWLDPFMSVLMRTESAQKPCTSYTAMKAKQGVTSEHLRRATGYPYYTLMPFVCERLFSTFLAFNPHLTIKHIA